MFKNRRIAALVSIFAVGVVFGILLRGSDTLYFRAVFVALAAVSGVICLFSARFERSERIKRISAAAFAVAAFSLGVLRVSVHNASSESDIRFSGKSDTAEFIVSEVASSYVDARVNSSELGIDKGESVRLYLESMPENIVAGDKITANAVYRYNDSIYLRASGISLTATCESLEIVSGESLLCKVRRNVSESSSSMYSEFKYADQISKSVIVGDRSDMDSYVFSLYNNAGISHVLAISGLHLSIIAMGVYNFLISLSVKRKICAVFGFMTAVVYTVLVGFSAGAVRAAVMLSVLLLSRMFMRRSDSFTSLFLALALLLLFNPYSMVSVGLQLSFLCSLGIMLAEPHITAINSFFAERKHRSHGLATMFYKLVPALISPAIVSFSASVFSFPVLFLSFDSVSYISPLINIVAVPLFTLGLKFALVAAIFYPLLPSVANIIAMPAGYLFDFVTDASERLYQSNIGSISMNAPLMFIPAALSVAVIAVLLFCSKRKKKAVLISASVFCVSLIACSALNAINLADKAVVEYGKASAEYVYVYSEDTDVYIDLGGYSANTRAVFENGRTALNDYIIVSLDSYALKRFENASGDVKISCVYVPEPKNAEETFTYQTIKELCNRRKCDIINYYDSVSAFAGGVKVALSGRNGDPANETYITIDVLGKSISLTGNGYSRAISSDIAVLFDAYNGNYIELKAESIYANEEIVAMTAESQRRLKPFDKRLRIEFDVSESDFEIYEP